MIMMRDVRKGIKGYRRGNTQRLGPREQVRGVSQLGILPPSDDSLACFYNTSNAEGGIGDNDERRPERHKRAGSPSVSWSC